LNDIINPKEIYNRYLNGHLSKREFIDKIRIIIENSNSIFKRVESLELLEKICIKNDESFKLLETCAVSDDDYWVRAIALRILANLFPIKSKSVLKWALKNDRSFKLNSPKWVFARIYEVFGWTKEKSLENVRKKIFKIINPMVKYYINEGVVPQEASLLALFELQYGNKVFKTESYNFDGIELHTLNHYVINKKGNIIAIARAINSKFIPKIINILSHLEKLILTGSNLKIIPKSIGKLKNLKVLNLSFNSIKIVPETFHSLKSLEILNLTSNKLNIIPDSICSLISLKKLCLGTNKITEIPKSISYLKNLELLELYENNITTIPESLGLIPSIKLVDLCFNNIKEIPSFFSSPPWINKLKI
ncbi:MAG: leucine-rich repeat domain-containing protein, partial [Candidatus Hodarchaeota archaeon]